MLAFHAKWVLKFADRVHVHKKLQIFPLGEAEIKDFARLKKEIERA